jgi:cell division inhibitor SepF
MKENLWHKTLVYFGFADEEYEESEEELDEEEQIFERTPSVRKINRSDSRNRFERTSHIRPVVEAPQSRVSVVEPRNFNDAQRIADKYKGDTPVIMNLQQVDSNLSKRLIDFASGMTYALDGGLQKVADKVFLITPKNVAVSAEEKRRLQEKGFFNQF